MADDNEALNVWSSPVIKLADDHRISRGGSVSKKSITTSAPCSPWLSTSLSTSSMESPMAKTPFCPIATHLSGCLSTRLGRSFLMRATISWYSFHLIHQDFGTTQSLNDLLHIVLVHKMSPSIFAWPLSTFFHIRLIIKFCLLCSIHRVILTSRIAQTLSSNAAAANLHRHPRLRIPRC